MQFHRKKKQTNKQKSPRACLKVYRKTHENTRNLSTLTSYERRQVLFLHDREATRRVTRRQITADCLSDMNKNHRQPATNTGYAAIHYSNRGVSKASFLVQQNQLVASNNFKTSDRGHSFSPLFLLL